MRIVNLTIELEDDEEAYNFEKWLMQYVKIKDFILLPDTTELYENDAKFREINKAYTEAKKLRNDYIFSRKWK